MRLSRFKFVLIALSLAGATLWITKHQNQNATHLASAKAPLSYSWQSNHSTTWQIDRATPQKQTLIYTQQMNYQDTSQRSDFSYPFVLLIDAQQHTKIQSQTGFSEHNQIIHFEKEVLITQFEPKNPEQNKTLSTQSITYNAQTNQVSTSAPVVIKQPQGTLTGTGLNANLETGYYQLLSNVTGVYQPQSQP
ncbi:LPS export ABC transporter periplasmic protein LptC [Thiomicrorhabdus aquaedulcis]|uniref:LPS export ABC transporter periplasmic protein LptC n=1 Tax=Thiomicrorhabdus aquaedulcis TaxID=2211106 RepID=UPI000FDA02FE|nr:LPS export ABC transporter periplasmic protein LptC [Thiomicrorhabdus aquaedulcis]